MIENLKPVSAETAPCKICGGEALLFGVVDFNRSCEIPNGIALALTGTPIYYRRCGSCGFLFTDAFDNWNKDEFRTYIYNDAYCSVDPGYVARGRTRMPKSWRDYGVRSSRKYACSTTAAATTCSAPHFAPAASRWQ
jgi:hypothetical protein